MRKPLTLVVLVVATLFSLMDQSMATEPHSSQTPDDTSSMERVSIPLPTQIQVKIKEHLFTLEVAVTEAEIRQGLMYRDSLAPNHGMLFKIEPARNAYFWMKNCKMPLDMLFIRHGKVVSYIDSAPPCTQDPCMTYDSVLEVDSVIELAAGTINQYQLWPGESVEWITLPEVSHPIDRK